MHKRKIQKSQIEEYLKPREGKWYNWFTFPPANIPHDIHGSMVVNDTNLKLSGKATLTENEKRVISITSNINKLQFVPFMTVDYNEEWVILHTITSYFSYFSLKTRNTRTCEERLPLLQSYGLAKFDG